MILLSYLNPGMSKANVERRWSVGSRFFCLSDMNIHSWFLLVLVIVDAAIRRYILRVMYKLYMNIKP